MSLFTSLWLQALQFLHIVDEADKWLEDLDSEMNTPESSDNLLILNDLLKKQEELEASFAAHRDHFQSLINRVQELQQEKHFLADEIEIRVDQVVHRCLNGSAVSPCSSLPSKYSNFHL